MAAARDGPLGGLDDVVDRLGLMVRALAELGDGDGFDLRGLPVGELLGARPGEHDAELDALLGGQLDRQQAQRRAAARAGPAGDGDARAAADRRVVGDLAPSVASLAFSSNGARRERGAKVGVAGAVGNLLGGGAVDRLHAHERGVALRAPGLAGRPADAVAGDELAAAHLGRRDVDVVVRGVGGVEADEARAVGEDLEHALDGLLGLTSAARLARLARLALLGAGGAAARTRRALFACVIGGGGTAARARGTLVALVLGRRGGTAARARGTLLGVVVAFVGAARPA